MTLERAREIFLNCCIDFETFDKEKMADDFIDAMQLAIPFFDDNNSFRIRCNCFIGGYFARERRITLESNPFSNPFKESEKCQS